MNFSHDDKLNEIAERTIAGERLSFEDGLALYASHFARAIETGAGEEPEKRSVGVAGAE